MIPPMLVPAMARMRKPARSSAYRTPMCASPRATPPPSATLISIVHPSSVYFLDAIADERESRAHSQPRDGIPPTLDGRSCLAPDPAYFSRGREIRWSTLSVTDSPLALRRGPAGGRVRCPVSNRPDLGSGAPHRPEGPEDSAGHARG